MLLNEYTVVSSPDGCSVSVSCLKKGMGLARLLSHSALAELALVDHPIPTNHDKMT